MDKLVGAVRKMIEMKEELFSFLENVQYDNAKELLLRPFADDLKNTHQNPKWHGEDDVLTHTDMVVEELFRQPEFSNLEKRKQVYLFCIERKGFYTKCWLTTIFCIEPKKNGKKQVFKEGLHKI